MRPKIHIIILALSASLALLGRPLAADKPKPAPPAPKKPQPPAEEPIGQIPEPQPGGCVYIQPGVKHCATIQGQGSFEVITYPPAAVSIRFEDEILTSSPPPPGLFQAQFIANTATISPVRTNLPARTVVLINTANVSVTINLVPGSLQKADTQVTISDPRRGSRDLEIERRVGEKVGARDKELGEREKKLEELATARAAEIIVEELAESGADVTSAQTERNSELIVIRSKKVLRVGNRRYLLFAVENLSGDDFEVKGVRVWVRDGENERELQPFVKVMNTTIAPNQEVQAAVSLPLPKDASGKAHLRVQVLEANPKRNVELHDVPVR